METHALPQFALPDSVTFGMFPDLCRSTARKLVDAGADPGPILLFIVSDAPRAPGDELATSAAPDRLLCITSGLLARQLGSDAIVAVKRREAPSNVRRIPRLRFKPGISVRRAFQELADAGTSAFALIQEGDHPYSVFFLREPFMVSEFIKELDRQRS